MPGKLLIVLIQNSVDGSYLCVQVPQVLGEFLQIVRPFGG
jgi:hypothetical protein